MAKLALLCLTSSSFFAILCTLTPSVYAVNVLAVLPSVWQSHYIFGKRLLQQLVEQEHQNYTVTLISGCTNEAVQNEPSTLSKIREIYIDKMSENWLDMGLTFDIEQAQQQSMIERFTRLIYAGTANVDLLLADSNVRKLLRSDEKFDLLIIDLFLSDALLGLALYYDVPTVVISPNGANTWLNRMIGNPQSSAFDPSNFLPYTERMSIWERVTNTLMGLFEKLTYNFFHMISQQAVYVKHFQTLYQLANNNTVPLPHHRDLTQNLSLALLNSHPVIQYPRAFLPNVLPVGGIHLTNQLHNIPNHLKSFIDSSSNGVIYISFGADARTVDLSREKLDALFDVISYMEEYNFLLKWEISEYPKDLPQNVFVNNWFPQEALLADPNVKVFISTCGLMSVLESINGLTPLLAIPIYPEQFVTALRLEAHGLAQIIKFDDFNYETLLNTLQELTTNNSYYKQLIVARQLLNADFGTPIEKSLHYIDLVLRTGGADHLKTHAHHLNFMRAKLFDVIAILILGLGGILAIPFLLICCILKRSYYHQSVAAAAATATSTAAASPTSITRSRSKVSLTTTTTTSKTGANTTTDIKKSSKNYKDSIGVMTTTMSMPDSLQNASHNLTRQFSASALWTTNTDRTSSSPTTSINAFSTSPMSISTSSTSSSSSSASSSSPSPSPMTTNIEHIAKRQEPRIYNITSNT